MWRKDSPQNRNYLLEGGCLVVQVPPLGEWSRKPSVSVYQLALLWEAMFGLSDFLFENSFNMFAHFILGNLQVHLPIPHWILSRFWPQMAWPQCPTLPIHWILPPQWLFCLLVSLMKNILKGKCFADVEEVRQKTAAALTGIKIKESKNWFEQ